MKKFIMLIATCMMIAGCSVNTKQETMENMEQEPKQEENSQDLIEKDEEDMEEMEEMPVLEDISVDIPNKEDMVTKPLEIEVDTLESQYSEDDTLVACVKIEYPIIENKSGLEGLNQINLFFKEAAQALFEENDTYANDNVEAMREAIFSNNDNKAEDSYCEYLVMVEIKYNENGLLSILQNFSEWNYDTDNTNQYSTGYVFDVNTGERLEISDILTGTEDEVNELIGNAFINSDKITDTVKMKYQEEILENTQYIEFYIDPDNLNLFYNPDMAVPYSEGILEASIPLSTKDLFELNFKQSD